MPLSPTTEVGTEDESSAKKHKLFSERADDDWESIEKPATGAYDDMEVSQNGLMAQSHKSVAISESGIKEMQDTAYSTAESGADAQPPENMLSKDW